MAPSEVRRIASSLFLVFLAMAASRHAINSFEAPSFSKADNPVAHHPSQLFRLLTFLYLPVFHLQLLIYPKVLSFDWSMDAIPLVVSPIDSRFLASIAFYACLAVACCTLIKHGGVVEDVILAIKQKRPNRTISCPSKDSTSRGRKFEKRESCQNVLIALALLILPFIPASNLFYYVGFVAAERTLYLPSVGYCILAGMLYSFSASRGGKNLALSAGLAILIVHGTRTWERNKDWRDEESLYRSALDINPPKGEVKPSFSNLGRIYASQMRLDDAEAAYRSAIAHRPNMADTWYNLPFLVRAISQTDFFRGVLYQEKKNLSEAIKCYSTAIQFRRTFAIAHLNLGIALESLNHESQAMLIWQTCSAIDGSLVKAQREHQNAQTSCRLRLARLLLRRRELRHVQIVLEEAIRQAPQFYPHVHSLLCTLGELYGILGQPSRAEQLFQAAFEASPTHVPTLLTMAHLYNKQNRTFESRTWFGKALAIAPNSADVYHHIGVAAASRGDLSEAEHAYRNALGIVGSHVDSLKALATLLREQQRNNESEEVLRRLIYYHPTAEALGDYGAILHLNGKLAEAKHFYEKSLTLDSDNKLTRENLRRLQRKIASSSKYS
ncbi:unnamed protein product [Heligmosomoides polygyrus]|uniref:dolichyl-phosphate-mannose--protein mannosyltransferase n=1 Tax=Heligmosomoides polygyrus TaxID=6339 RepID=A0A183G899_HELPZ|nr:unnamed protein product [Heligmosomoides polygyrus]